MSGPGIRCFLIEPSARARVYLRRYGGTGCPLNGGQYHNALVLVDGVEAPAETASVDLFGVMPAEQAFAGDPRWPSACRCGYVFDGAAFHSQASHEHIYRRVDTGEETTLREAPAGAIWRATWREHWARWCGPDGRAYVVRCPGRHWNDWDIDNRASNCTQPEDDVHRCWCRHGVAPDFTVDKNPEPGQSTCAAGAGSIQAGAWHGFLRGGYLVAA